MGSRFFTSDTAWVPQDDGVANGDTVTFSGIAKGGQGADGDAISTTGGGGGGGEFRSASTVIPDASLTYNVYINETSAGNTRVESPDAVDIILAIGGTNASMDGGGAGGSGGTGLVGYSGGAGANGDNGGDIGGGGGGAAGDTTAGSAASGATGGAGVTQFGTATQGAGGAGGSGGAGSMGTLYGGGGGGGGINGAGAAGRNGAAKATWGAAGGDDIFIDCEDSMSGFDSMTGM